MFLPNQYFQIRDTKITLPNAKNPFNFLAFGDIHLSKIVGQKVLDKLKWLLESEETDYYIFLGDLIDSPLVIDDDSKYAEVMAFISYLASIKPVFIILGNHDFIVDENHEQKTRFNYDFFVSLNSIKNVTLIINNIIQSDSFNLMGYNQTLDYYYNRENGKIDPVAFYQDFEPKKELYADLPKDKPNIALIHSPEFTKSPVNQDLLNGYDIILSAHTHDGCVPLGIDDGNWGIISPKKELFPQNIRGIRTLDNGTYLIINGGITKIQYCAPKILHWLNVFCPMQLDKIQILPGEEKTLETSKRIVLARTKK